MVMYFLVIISTCKLPDRFTLNSEAFFTKELLSEPDLTRLLLRDVRNERSLSDNFAGENSE